MGVEEDRKELVKDMKFKLFLFIGFIGVCFFFYFAFVHKFLNRFDDVGIVTGNIAGGFGSVTSTFFSDLGLYISSMSLVVWLLIGVVVVGGLLVWYLKNKYDLKFSWGRKKPKKTFN